ncbi:MAG: undecaprenyl-diphosphate phosphatase, partial [Thermodesulfobacteriota bacterium]
IPAILGALWLEVRSGRPGSLGAVQLGLGFAAALVAGLVALALLLGVIRRAKLHYFAYYCWLLGLATLLVSLRG